MCNKNHILFIRFGSNYLQTKNWPNLILQNGCNLFHNIMYITELDIKSSNETNILS